MKSSEYLLPMPAFEYIRPASIKETVELLSEESTFPIAGGTDLVILINNGKIIPKKVVDITRLGLSYIREENGEIIIGSNITFQQIAESEKLRRYACLVESAKSIGTWQIRNLATIGGNLANASPAADSVPPLLTLDSKVVIVGKDGEREINMEDFFYGPRKTDLKKGELIKEIRFMINKKLQSGWERIGRRSQNTLSVVSVAVSGIVENRKFYNARIALGAASPYPILALRAMQSIEGKELTDEIIEAVAFEASKESKPISDVRGSAEYRRIAITALTKRLLKSLAESEIE
ncbi:MAG: FAD binding domain-containing protein [Nitrososphaeria archaeon]